MEACNFDLLERLRTVSTCQIVSTCRSIPPSAPPFWGVSTVTVLEDHENMLTLFERGKWVNTPSSREIVFTNILRFRQIARGNLTLEHLRYGSQRPVPLLEFFQVDANHYTSSAPHVCGGDIYAGGILFDAHFVHLNWHITGPNKRRVIRTVYT